MKSKTKEQIGEANAENAGTAVPHEIHPPEYYKSPNGQWIECVWDAESTSYTCFKIDVDQLPKPIVTGKNSQ